MAEFSIHPAVDNGLKPAGKDFLRRHADAPGAPRRKSPCRSARQVAHNHVCGCTKCWKPSGALFSSGRGGSPRDKVKVTANEYEAQGCRSERDDQALRVLGLRRAHVRPHRQYKHPFYGLDFVHTELSSEPGWAPPEFAAFVSSIIESGAIRRTWARCARGSKS